MLIERFMLASRDDELDAVLSGATTTASIHNKLPFNTFYPIGLERIELGAITVFSGSAKTEKQLLLRILAAKLGKTQLPKAVNRVLFEEYLKLCVVCYTDFQGKENVNVVHISLEDVDAYLENNCPSEKYKRSPLELYDRGISSGEMVFLEEPERYLSFEEQTELAYHIECMADDNTQFVITSNSACFLGMKNAKIYDFDNRPILPHTWHNSKLAKSHERFYEELIKKHHATKKEENA